MKHFGFCIIWLWMAIFFLFPVSTSMAATDKTVCPIMRPDGHQLRHIYKENLDVSGFDLAESFSLRQASCGGEKTCFKLGSTPLIRDTRIPGHSPFSAKEKLWHLWTSVVTVGKCYL
ncbi:collagen alpha-1(XIX) chain-like isoform X2 [Gopherus evgoodei]|uniref:collagen alpha-1(XIX) chain-like isoform X2 n=1 Tax=Gopherus evgoodei TaxID=1825980 RepID=UPI0011CFC6D8|nr:collagen alpha-1(XIX) chain-like isoform X2 [Gopherus evgoodei]